MNLRPISRITVIFTQLLVAGQAFSADPLAVAPAFKDQLKTTLKAEVKRLTEGKPEHILRFYESVEEAMKAYQDSPQWKLLAGWTSPTNLDLVTVARFGEITVLNNPLSLSQATKELIEANQEEALTACIQLTQSEFSGTARIAAEVVKQYRDKLTDEQWRMILAGRQYVIRHRDSYPAGIHARADGYSWIPFGYVFLSDSEARSLDAHTNLFVDGEQKYPRGIHGLGWRSDVGYIGFGKLSVDRHTLQLKTTYEFKLGDIQIKDVNESQEIKVEITSADTPDHLAATVDEKLIAEVEAGVVVGDKTEAREFTYSKPLGNSKFKSYAKILVPAIKVVKPLSVSLCMKPEIYIDGEEKPLTRHVLAVPAGQTTTRVLENWVRDPRLSTLLKEKAEAYGKLRAKLVLRPSRADALSDPTVKSYYPRVIEREIEFSWRPVE